MDYARGRYKRRKRGGLLTGRWLQEFRGQCPKNIEESKPKCRRCQLELKLRREICFPIQAFRPSGVKSLSFQHPLLLLLKFCMFVMLLNT